MARVNILIGCIRNAYARTSKAVLVLYFNYTIFIIMHAILAVFYNLHRIAAGIFMLNRSRIVSKAGPFYFGEGSVKERNNLADQL